MALEESESIMLRFQGLLRISELEDTRRRSGFESFQPASLLTQAHEFFEPLAQEQGLTLLLELSDDIPALSGDVSLLFEALVNLLDNAIKFTPKGGVIHLSGALTDSSINIEVSDNGPGIPEAERENVIRRLYRGDSTRQKPGHGLGLSLVSAIVRLHGFVLRIQESPRGGGATVSIICPLPEMIVANV